MTVIKNFLILILYLSVCTECYAAAKIQYTTGAVAHGAVLTIHGNDFGYKINSEPIRFDNFEAGVIGDRLDVYDTWWTCKSETSFMLISSENKRGVSSKTLESFSVVDTVSSQCWRNNVGFVSTGKFYINLWIYFDVAQSNNDIEYQLKSFVVPSNVESNGKPISPVLLHTIRYYLNTANISSYVQNYSGLSTQYLDRLLIINEDTGVWHNIALQGEFGTEGNADGRYIMWHSQVNTDNAIMVMDDYWPEPEHLMILQGESAGNSFYFYNFIGNTDDDIGDPPWMKTYYDDVYIDNSWARVEIGDKQSYDECVIREIQVPKKWGRVQLANIDKISIELNQGALTSVVPVYLFVVNDQGVVSDQDGNSANGSQGYELHFQ